MDRWEAVYDAMMGELVDPCPGIDDAFAPGEKCGALYEEIFQANRRICARLGVEEDVDLERMISNFFEINRELCYRMYQYGKK